MSLTMTHTLVNNVTVTSQAGRLALATAFSRTCTLLSVREDVLSVRSTFEDVLNFFSNYCCRIMHRFNTFLSLSTSNCS